MRVRIYLRDTREFTLNNVVHMGLMKHMYDGKYRRIMYFRDTELGCLGYPIAEISEMVVEG